MKITYEKKLPDAAAFYQLTDGTQNADEQYKRYEQAAVVAAYDGEKLVGVGGLASEEWSFTIHPGYACRDIEHNMKKLASW